MFDRHADVIRVNTRYVITMPLAACIDYYIIVAVSATSDTAVHISRGAVLSDNGRTARQTILWRCITQTDYRVIAIYTTAHTPLTAAGL